MFGVQLGGEPIKTVFPKRRGLLDPSHRWGKGVWLNDISDFAAGPHGAHECCCLQRCEVLGDGLASDADMSREAGRRLWLVCQHGEQLSPGLVG